MAHTKAGGSTKLGRDSAPKYLGVKISDGQYARSGNIIVRQRGTHFRAGKGVKRGADDTLYAQKEGTVKFRKKIVTNFSGAKKKTTIVEII